MTTDEAPATTEIEVAIDFQRDLYLYWWAVRAIGGLPLTTRGYIARPALRRLREQWPTQGIPGASAKEPSEQEDPRQYFIRRLLERLGLLRIATPALEGRGDAAQANSRGRDAGNPLPARRRMAERMPSREGAGVLLVAAEPAMMARFVAHPLAERLRICTRLWVAGGWWPDGKPTGEALGLHAPLPPRIAVTRRRLVELLAASQPGSPMELPGVNAATDYAPRIVGATAATATHRKPHDIAEERQQTMRAALNGPLRWLGLVTRGEATPGSVAWLATAAALALRNDPDAITALVQETPGRVVIQPNLSIIAYPPLTAPTLLMLDGCAGRGAFDRVAHYTLTRETVTRAQQSGWSDDEIARRLEELSGTPLPGTVRVRLADWTRAASRIRLTEHATLLSTTTPAVLDALLANQTTSRWVERRLGPTLALIAADHLEAVRRWLLAHGELPAVDTPPPPPSQ